MLRILYVMEDPDMSLIGEERLHDLPLGLRTLFLRAVKSHHPTMITFGNEPDLRNRVQNGVMENSCGNRIIKSVSILNVQELWISFLTWFDWYHGSHWKNVTVNNGIQHAYCADCGQYIGRDVCQISTPIPLTRCPNRNCESRAMWRVVDGEQPS